MTLAPKQQPNNRQQKIGANAIVRWTISIYEISDFISTLIQFPTRRCST